MSSQNPGGRWEPDQDCDERRRSQFQKRWRREQRQDSLPTETQPALGRLQTSCSCLPHVFRPSQPSDNREAKKDEGLLLL